MTNNIKSDDWIILLVYILFGFIFLQQAWANLIQKSVSMFSLDRFAIVISELFANKEHKAETRRLSKDPTRLRMQGILALLFLLGSIREIYKWLIENL